MSAHVVARVLTEVAEAVFAVCDDVAEVAASAWGHDGTPTPSSEDLGIDETCRTALDRAPLPLAGAGVVLAPGVLLDRRYWLRWWQPSAEGPRPLRIQLDPSAVDFRDYTTLPWFAVPTTRGIRHVTGPYVDYLCTDCYTLTFTRPLTAGGHVVGVAGADVLVHDLETHLFSRADVDEDVEWIAVMDSGRVVTAVNSETTTGDLLRELDPPGDAWEVDRCPGLPLQVRSRRMRG